MKRSIKPIEKLLEKLIGKIQAAIAQAYNYYYFRKKKIPKFEYKLRKHFLKKFHQFGTNDFYQSYPPLKIRGVRDTICRFKIYGLDKELTKKQVVLDIGGNISFFSAYISRYVSKIDVVEFDKSLTDIGEKLVKKERINNLKIHNIDFKKFYPGYKYDLILSLAIHKWVGMDFKSYLKRIHSFLKEDGKLLLESHGISYYEGDNLEDSLNKIKFFTIIKKDIIDDQQGRIREFFWLKKA